MENNEVSKCANDVVKVLLKYDKEVGFSVITSLVISASMRFNLSKSEFFEIIGPRWDKIHDVLNKKDLDILV